MTTVSITVPTASKPASDWHAINWRVCDRRVRGLQCRVAKKTKERQWHRIARFQRLFSRSFAAKALEVKRITGNRGGQTAGVDGETWGTPQMKWEAMNCLNGRGYKPRPLRRVHVPKAHGKRRPLEVPTMTERATRMLILMTLNPVAETMADPNSYGFRKKRSTADARVQAFTALSRRISPHWILEETSKDVLTTSTITGLSGASQWTDGYSRNG
ncbi:MAG: reverse transcriptase N-terminal domain-containing protein [Hyphomicrobiales bacterium]